MTVYVDELRAWGPTHLRFLRQSCHLTADTLDELHRLAAELGLRATWFQPHPRHPHYDLTATRRAVALALGAVFVPAKEQAAKRLAHPGPGADGVRVPPAATEAPR